MLRVVLALLCLHLTVVEVIRAQPLPTGDMNDGPTWTVELSENSRCRKFPGFATAIERHLPHELIASRSEAALVAQITVSHNAQARIVVIDQQSESQVGVRVMKLPTDRCEEIAGAIGFVLVVMAEAGEDFVDAGQAQPPPEAEADLPVEPLFSPEEQQAAAADEGDGGRRRQQLPQSERYAWLGPRAGHDLTVAVGTGYGLLPSPSLGGSVEWRIRSHRAWPIGLHGTGWLPSALSDTGKVEFFAFYFGVMTCPLHLDRPRVHARLCPGMAGGGYRWRSSGYLWNRTRKDDLWLAELEAAFELRLVGPVELVVLARMDLPMIRSQATISSPSATDKVVFEVSPVTASGFAGLGLRFR